MPHKVCIDSLRCFAAALPQAANSGHPGAPMGLAPLMHVLYSDHLKHCPKQPKWLARDYFVLSNGHACAIQYSMLHLLGYKLSLDDLRNFRRLHSPTPGHPEANTTDGITVTSGPLGQGISQSVGLAIAAEMMCARYNKPDITLFDPYIYAVVGDGCLQEGVASEACSLAGHLRLGRLIALYDDNQITIDGETSLSFSEDVAMRFKAYGWEVLTVEDANTDLAAISSAIKSAKANLTQPSLIICKTVIGFGSLKQGTEAVHGAPLGIDDIKQAKAKFNLEPSDDLFYLDDKVKAYYRDIGMKWQADYDAWEHKYRNQYASRYHDLYAELEARLTPASMQEYVDKKLYLQKLPTFTPETSKESTRALSGKILNLVADHFNCIVGGSADLTSSNCTALKNAGKFSPCDRTGRYIHFGVREHAMAAICNGIYAFGGFKPFCATFMNFFGYAWGAVRLSALSKFPVLYIATHDSIELGEDGPTHQPIEFAALCRATPNLYYIRPSDGNEVVGAYMTWLASTKTPVMLALCRSGTPCLQGTSSELTAQRGAYIIKDFDLKLPSTMKRIVLGASGTEVSLCVEAAKLLQDRANVRVVSMPCWEIFEAQPVQYKQSILPADCHKLYVEAASVPGYPLYYDQCIQMNQFGASAPKKDTFEYFGYTPKNIVQCLASVL